jgi:hypothetical protein
MLAHTECYLLRQLPRVDLNVLIQQQRVELPQQIAPRVRQHVFKSRRRGAVRHIPDLSDNLSHAWTEAHRVRGPCATSSDKNTD